MDKAKTPTEVVIGVFYQRSKDPLDVVYSVGGDSTRVYGHDAHGKSFENTPEEIGQWKQLRVNDFPRSLDPRLSHVYDLHWDIKRVSDLHAVDPDNRAAIEMQLVEDFGIKNPLDNLRSISGLVQERNDIENGYMANEYNDFGDTPEPGR